MKLFSFTIAAALLLFSQLTAAAPVPSSTGNHTTSVELRGVTTAPSAQELIDNKLIHSPRKDKSLFFTGISPRNGGDPRALRADATALAASQDFDILGNMLQPAAHALITGPDAAITKLTADQAKQFVKDFWDNGSEAFARLTTGQVTLMMEGDPATGPQPEASSVFQRVERKILEEGTSSGVVTGVDRIGRDFKTTGVKVPFAL
ncbi:hypothetical protein C8F01DRAFT_103256 [Mycena amicta]|nr:hypothetical protein C8F01DRAFT_103256 [Mycena amicta]